MSFIEITDVVKQYKGHKALDHVSLSVPQGCIYGLLGPNGAGKTTLIRIINMITAPDSGSVMLDGRPITPDDVAHIGYLPEERGLYKKMKVGEEIVYLARLKGMTKADATAKMEYWLKRFNLSEWRDKKVETLSKGMQQKVQFIATVIHEPKLLIFDEPFSGFDPVNAEQLKREILELQRQGATILFSTHNMESVEEVCERITLINHSQVVLEGNVADIKQRYKKHLYEITLAPGEVLEPCPELFTIEESRPGGTTLIRLATGVEMRTVITRLNEQYTLAGFRELLPSMHEIFIETVQNSSTNE
ncbi:MAG: ATP-binding cassette domain-containing protein [Bacteroidales bacterium]|nr:ATP-binding cassette domain-containing protein [Bacteroidales bacterium]